MEPIITEQIEKFQSGDFSGYESFYYATSQTVYTMLHTIIPDENTAAELMPKVYGVCLGQPHRSISEQKNKGSGIIDALESIL